MRRHRLKVGTKLGVYIPILVIFLAAYFPIAWMVSSSLKPNEDLFVIPPQWIPRNPTMESFQSVIFGSYGRPSNFPVFFKNSSIVTIATTALSLFIALLAGYGFSRYRFRGSNMVLLFILLTQMFPGGLILISLYLTFSSLGLINTYTSMVLANTTFALPFSVWILKGFYDTIPRELEEAARVDGCSRIGALFRVILPTIVPGLIAVGVYVFLIAWDEYMFASILTSRPEMRTLPPGIVSTYIGQFYLNWGSVMASSTAITIPVVILFIFFQKYLVQGLTAGAVKE